MKKSEAIELANACTQKLVEGLGEGDSETLCRYLNAMARFHRYSLNNILMIYSQCPQAEQVAGYTTWKRLGRWVKPGEKGIAIVAPVVRKQAQTDKAKDDDEESAKCVSPGLVDTGDK